MTTLQNPRTEYKRAPRFEFRSTKATNNVEALKAYASRGTSFSNDLNSLHQPEKSGYPMGKTEKISLTDSEWIDKVPECPVYHPTEVEFEDPFLYLRSIGSDAAKYGMCKIVSPLSSSVPAGTVLKKEMRDFKFTTKVQPLRLPAKNNKVKFYMRGRQYTFRDFEKMANKVFARKYSVSGCLPSKYVEREFWREMARGKKRTVEYGADLDATAFSCDPSDLLGKSKWNLKKLPWLPNSVLRLLEGGIPGVTDPMLYIGMLFSMFAWHVEDHYLYSMSYLHCGAPKTWYGVPSRAASEFEKVIESHIYDNDILSSDGKVGPLRVLLERTTMFPPYVLMQQGVPVYKAVQLPGEFVINFPRSYHAGFNQGFNCSEAVNFASSDWFPFGAEATKNYALFSKTPVVPYEELLCKEAMLLTKSANRNYNFHGDRLSAYCIKISFAPLMRMYQFARVALKKSGAFIRVSSSSEGMVLCTLCQRGCYVAYFMCSCHRNPLCLFHEIDSYKCLHQSKCTIFVQRDIEELEYVAKKFEQEKGIKEAVEERMKSENNKWMQNLIPGMANDYEDADMLDRFDIRERCCGQLDVEIKSMLKSPDKCCKRARSRRSPQKNRNKKTSNPVSEAFLSA